MTQTPKKIFLSMKTCIITQTEHHCPL
nr:unnamed protein product [Callosobruchus analis]